MSHHDGEAWSSRSMDDSEKDRKFAKWLRFSRKHSANIFRNFCDEGFNMEKPYELLLSACDFCTKLKRRIFLFVFFVPFSQGDKGRFLIFGR